MTELAGAEVPRGERCGLPREVLVVGCEQGDAELLRELLGRETPEVELTHAARAAALAEHRADLVIVFGAELARDVCTVAPHADVVAVLTAPVTTAAVRRLLDQGVKGVVSSDRWPTALGAACSAVSAGQICVPATVRAAVEPPALSLRERQVLALIAEGLSNADIAKRLFLAESTVKSHAAAAFRRLGVNSRREAVALVLGSDDTLRRILLSAHRPERSRFSRERYPLDPRG